MLMLTGNDGARRKKAKRTDQGLNLCLTLVAGFEDEPIYPVGHLNIPVLPDAKKRSI